MSSSASSSNNEKTTHNGDKKTADDYHSLSYAFKTYLREDKEERSHWEDVCRSYRQYATFAVAQRANLEYRVSCLPEEQRTVLPSALRLRTAEHQTRESLFKEAAIRNQFCLDCILRHAGQPHSQEYLPSHDQVYSADSQMSKVSSVLKSLYRDYSAEGKVERDMAYVPILKQLESYVPIQDKASPPRVCVPGAGTGRLVLDIAAKRYSVQGNEFSLYMLLASDYILNGGLSPDRPIKISPWLLESRNVHESIDPMRIVQIPDIDPFLMLKSQDDTAAVSADDDDAPEFSMAAGDFVSIYSAEREQAKWDAVVSCFFLDASSNAIETLQVIHKMLKPGGVLVNFGPLLWHWSGPAMRPDDKSVEEYHKRYSHLDPKYLTSVDLSWEDMKEIIQNIGFEIVELELNKRCLYTADLRSMMNMEYKCVSFVARKLAAKSPSDNEGSKQGQAKSK